MGISKEKISSALQTLPYAPNKLMRDGSASSSDSKQKLPATFGVVHIAVVRERIRLRYCLVHFLCAALLTDRPTFWLVG